MSCSISLGEMDQQNLPPQPPPRRPPAGGVGNGGIYTQPWSYQDFTVTSRCQSPTQLHSDWSSLTPRGADSQSQCSFWSMLPSSLLPTSCTLSSGKRSENPTLASTHSPTPHIIGDPTNNIDAQLLLNRSTNNTKKNLTSPPLYIKIFTRTGEYFQEQ